MPAIRSGGPMSPGNDDDLDRELAAALAVEPSAEFLARVRMRIAREPDPPAWRLSTMFAAAGACAVAIALVLAATQLNRAARPADPDRVPPPSSAFPDLSLVLPTIVAAPFAGAPLATAAATPRRAQKPTPEMQAIMQSNAHAGTALRAHMKERDYDAIARDAATYKQNFAYIAVFWANQKINYAVTVSTRGLTAAMDLEAAALARDDGGVEKAMIALTDTCGACHKEHREELPDKTYAIRL
jgi:cytochrome c556